MHTRVERVLQAALCLWVLCGPGFALAAGSADRASGWAVATAHPMATEAAYSVAAQGGNAFDAAVAVTAALAVVEPMGSGIGGAILVAIVGNIKKAMAGSGGSQDT